MVHKHCCYGICKSVSRHKDRSYVDSVGWIPFPKPSKDLEKCRKWIRLCGRPAETFTLTKVNKDTYICSKHFVGEKGPTNKYPDPLPAVASETERNLFLRKKSRKSPMKRVQSCCYYEKTETGRGMKRPRIKTFGRSAFSLSSVDAPTQTVEVNFPEYPKFSPGKAVDQTMCVAQVLNELSPEKENVSCSEAKRETPKLLRYALLKEPLFFKPEMTRTDHCGKDRYLR